MNVWQQSHKATVCICIFWHGNSYGVSWCVRWRYLLFTEEESRGGVSCLTVTVSVTATSCSSPSLTVRPPTPHHVSLQSCGQNCRPGYWRDHGGDLWERPPQHGAVQHAAQPPASPHSPASARYWQSQVFHLQPHSSHSKTLIGQLLALMRRIFWWRPSTTFSLLQVSSSTSWGGGITTTTASSPPTTTSGHEVDLISTCFTLLLLRIWWV